MHSWEDRPSSLPVSHLVESGSPEKTDETTYDTRGEWAVEFQRKGEVTIGLWREEPRAGLPGHGCKGPEVQGFHESKRSPEAWIIA